MRRTYQPRFIRIVVQKLDGNVDALLLEQNPGPSDREFANAAGAKAATKHDALGLLP